MTSTPTTPEVTRPGVPGVTAFVADVRSRLADLTDDQRDELLEGLEADLSEQLADGAIGVLDDPATYAAELRAAAGLPAQRRRFLAAPSGDWLGRDLDRARRAWSDGLGRHPRLRQTWDVLVALRPAWWLVRAWVAVTLLDQAVGPWEPVTLVPGLVVPGLGLLVLAAATVGSALVGTGRVWPGGGPRRRGVTRVVLVLLNAVALIGLVGLAEQSSSMRLEVADGYAYAVPTRGVTVDGREVRNIYPYDAQGQPITTGVQLFDGAGRRVALTPGQAAGLSSFSSTPGRVGCPWVNGTQRLFNVFPLPEREQRPGTSCQERLDARYGSAVLPTPPLAEVPPVALPSPSAP